MKLHHNIIEILGPFTENLISKRTFDREIYVRVLLYHSIPKK